MEQAPETLRPQNIPDMTRAVLATVQRQYQAAPGAQLAVTAIQGGAGLGTLPAGLPPRVVVGALAEAQRWGEPCVVEGVVDQAFLAGPFGK